MVPALITRSVLEFEKPPNAVPSSFNNISAPPASSVMSVVASRVSAPSDAIVVPENDMFDDPSLSAHVTVPEPSVVSCCPAEPSDVGRV